MEKYGVLVVDDSAVMRKKISSIINASPQFFVIGKARNGIDAIEKVKRLNPSIVLLDVEMPELDGFETLKILMNEMPLPIIMLSNNPECTLEALHLGAVDVVLKSRLIETNDEIEIEEFFQTLFLKVQKKVEKADSLEEVSVKPKAKNVTEKKDIVQKKDIIIFGSSTGGPSALQNIITKFPSDFSIPILLIQHMPKGFTKPLADRFSNLCQLKVKEAEDNEILEGGTIYIAPAGLQTLLSKNSFGQYVVAQKNATNIETLYKPSIDVTLLSVSNEAKDKLLTIILTGMGDDGLRGCRSAKKFGGTVLAESEETCVVYGMPKVVFEAGLVDKQLPLSNIFDEIMAILA